MDIVAVDQDTGRAYISAAYAGELLSIIRALETELVALCNVLEKLERERPLTFTPIES